LLSDYPIKKGGGGLIKKGKTKEVFFPKQRPADIFFFLQKPAL
jgi:hypothetical protein